MYTCCIRIKRQKTNADIVCFITHDISKKDKKKLEIVFDRVIYVPYISPYDMGGKGDLKTIMMDPEIFKNCQIIQNNIHMSMYFLSYIYSILIYFHMKKFVLLIRIWFH